MTVVISVKKSVAAATKQITQQQREIVGKLQDPISSAASFLSGLLPRAASNQRCFNSIKSNRGSSGEVPNQTILIYVKLVLKTTTILIFARIQIRVAMNWNFTVTSMAGSCWLSHVLVGCYMFLLAVTCLGEKAKQIRLCLESKHNRHLAFRIPFTTRKPSIAPQLLNFHYLSKFKGETQSSTHGSLFNI